MNSSRAKDGTIGERIAMIRYHRLMTQAELAAAIGVSRSVISHIERGHTRIDLDMAKRLAAALHCTVGDLLVPLEARQASWANETTSSREEVSANRRRRPFASVARRAGERPKLRKPV
jgi:transcriptional regulator with XRE-family HTH domain